MLNDRDVRKLLLKTYKLSPSEFTLYMAIREIFFFWNGDCNQKSCYASNEVLSEEANISTGSVRRLLKTLQDRGLIEIHYSKVKGFYDKRNLYPLEDRLLKTDAQKILNERESLVKREEDTDMGDHTDDQNDHVYMINLERVHDQNDHINNQSLNNQSLNNKKDICDAQNDHTYVNSRIEGADAPVATSGNPHFSHQAIKDRWNAIAEKYKLQTINIVSPDRIASLKARIKDIGGEEAFWSTVERAIKNSAFLRGQNNRKWRATFNWILKPSKFIQMAEGAYSDSGSLLDDPKKPIQEAADDDWITDFFTFDKEA